MGREKNQSKSNKHCLICESSRLKMLKGYERHNLCRCEDCGFVFCKEIPSEEELINHYKGYGRNDYLSPVTVKRYNELLDLFERELKRMGHSSKVSVLDWGAGIGYFLDEAMKRDWIAYGTEYTDNAVDICQRKGIKMYQGSLNAVDLEMSSLDVICSFEVIEHINNPIKELKEIWRLLKPGGLFYCTTPNFNSLLRYYLKDEYNVITYPEHLSYFTPASLNMVLRTIGFQKVFLKTII